MNDTTPRVHKMNLNDAPFKLIKAGSKTVEMRLYDEKRQLLKTGDVIIFTNNMTEETLTVSVAGLYRYKDFTDLYAHHDKISIGYLPQEKAEPGDMLLYYSEELIEKYGTLAIKIKLI